MSISIILLAIFMAVLIRNQHQRKLIPIKIRRDEYRRKK
ncbi:hypothetical Protein YC6258_02518 [Gynuella sunshinyii YC6258]|uniref:Uncharacterized protein n=1 Tax=Gynuella sunshinyii YC6258 TaxID=1445510 RepID=A0A0C5VJU4_9GAMM|nr:hypothetical Protein YC6258_02518 [Gynuella sunshinyii YC6258]